jgi:hypothetical protein
MSYVLKLRATSEEKTWLLFVRIIQSSGKQYKFVSCHMSQRDAEHSSKSQDCPTKIAISVAPSSYACFIAMLNGVSDSNQLFMLATNVCHSCQDAIYQVVTILCFLSINVFVLYFRRKNEMVSDQRYPENENQTYDLYVQKIVVQPITHCV